jgi:hypothetical protein
MLRVFRIVVVWGTFAASLAAADGHGSFPHETVKVGELTRDYRLVVRRGGGAGAPVGRQGEHQRDHREVL